MYLESDTGRRIYPIQKVLGGAASEESVGALKRFSRLNLLVFPMMDVITEYFVSDGFEVIAEPFLSQGRADLGIHKNGRMDLFVEIGTMSAHKLWWNLQVLTNCTVALVPDEKRVIEFICGPWPRGTATRQLNEDWPEIRDATAY